MRDIRCGYPVCNTGELLRPGEIEAALKEVDHPFVGFLQARLDAQHSSRSCVTALLDGLAREG